MSTELDSDGDGIDNDADNCPDSYNPGQDNLDGDTLGDSSDSCPLVPESSSCDHDPSDVDDDGTANESDNCPWIHNPDQSNVDGDDDGDVCDLCPTVDNSNGQGCPVTIMDIRDPASTNAPPQGSVVTIENAIVTATTNGVGMYIQDPSATEYAGIFVYDSGFSNDAAVGDTVTVNGTYIEYYDLSELTNPSITVQSSGGSITPIAVTDPCTLATNGADAERYEGMLVSLPSVTVTDANPDGAELDSNGNPRDYQESEVAGCLRVDDRLFDYTSTGTDYRALGTSYNALTGIQSYSFSNHKLFPRFSDDLQ